MFEYSRFQKYFFSNMSAVSYPNSVLVIQSVPNLFFNISATTPFDTKMKEPKNVTPPMPGHDLRMGSWQMY